MKSPLNVLVFPCGSEPGSEIYYALRYSLHARLVGLSSVSDHGEFVYDNYYGNAPYINTSEFIDFFKDFIKKESIDLIFPTHDTVAEYLSPICQELGVALVNGNSFTTGITRKKSLTYQHFLDQAWIPRVYHRKDVAENMLPVVVKPDQGQGAQGVSICHSLAQLDAACRSVREPLIVEYLPGQEVTVDCFTDRHRQLLVVAPRTRDRIRAGISMRSEVVPLDEVIQSIAETINRRIVFRGPWFFQLKKDTENQWKLLEISCRIAGTMVLERARGINLPLLTIQDHLERDISVLALPHVTKIDRRIVTKSQLNHPYRKVYIDLDDTLISAGKVIPEIIQFIYQEHANGKSIILITRHEMDPLRTLESAHVCASLFSEIIHITDKSKKSIFIDEDSIFVDNHFPERRDVFLTHHIPVLDVDMIQFFIR